MFDRTLAVIAAAFDARVIRAGKLSEPVDLGPDHYARLTAADRFIKRLMAGRPRRGDERRWEDDAGGAGGADWGDVGAGGGTPTRAG